MKQNALKHIVTIQIAKAGIALALVLGLSSASLAETIAGAMAKAYANNPDLNAARASLRAVDEGVPIAKSGYRPRISANATGTAVRFDSNSIAKPLDYTNRSAGITITQQVFDGFQTLNSVRVAEASAFAERESMRANEISTLLSAAEAFANVARDQDVVAIRKQNLSFLRQQVDAAGSRQRLGEGTLTDVNQAETQAAEAKALLAAAIAQLRQSEATYLQIVGSPASGIKQAKPAVRNLPRTLDLAVATGIKEHPAIAAALHRVDAADYRVKQAEGTMLPGVTLQGSISRSLTDQPGEVPNSSNAAVTARIEIPIYQGGAEYGQIRQAKERAGQQAILVDSIRAEVRQTIMQAYAQLDGARATILATRERIAAATRALSGVIEERKVGQRTTIDVLDAQQSVLAARETLAAAQRNAVVASYSLLAATGRLTVAGQGLPVAEYDAERHYNAVKNKAFGASIDSAR
ncbi:TolC family outer membrane protein [Xaviernesmea rhizosphaerae]|uniref:TolC family outer membrane protein n=1 Tax=Xaviernesmea rhizosphaerae TaxID=1672749 RepID=UPI000A6D7181|nr:TolC family outer membrane protein [Xaviernesmea rhizosphaerae]